MRKWQLSEDNGSIIILGIDPGLATAGYGVIRQEGSHLYYVDSGEISTNSKTDFGTRLLKLSNWLRDILDLSNPDVGVVEETFYGANAKTALQMGHARGALLLTLAQSNVKSVEYSARKIKQAVVGNGAASKEQVEYMVKNLLNLDDISGQHASDALAAAICHANHGTVIK